MVTIKRATATADLSSARRLLSSRLSQLNAASAATATRTSSQRKSSVSMPASRRQDQRSTVSIAGSSSHSSVAQRSPGTDQRATPRSQRPHHRGRLRRKATGDDGGGADRCFQGANSGVSNSAGGEKPPPPQRGKARAPDSTVGTADDDPARVSSRVSCGTHQRMGKTVSISASHDHTASTRFDVARRSIIKLKPLPGGDQPCAAHNDAAPGVNMNAVACHATPLQVREQKILEECRFIPWDPFYKKVAVAPGKDRQFFAAPKCIRVPGSRILYDIAKENALHHRDVNLDFTRDSVKRYCPNFSRPSHFRHLC